MPPILKKSINQVQLENGIYEQIVYHFDRELELKDLEDPDELHINTVAQHATKQKSEKSKPTRHRCKTSSYYQNQGRQLREEKDQDGSNKNSAGNYQDKIFTVVKQTLTFMTTKTKIWKG